MLSNQINFKLKSLLYMMCLMFAFTFLVACNSDSPSHTPSIEPYVYQIPEQTNDDWQTGTLTEVGLKTEGIETFVLGDANDVSHMVAFTP